MQENIALPQIICFRAKNLFGDQNYNIDFNNPNNVSVLIGHNGFGKTSILRFLNFIFNPSQENDYLYFPFDEMSCDIEYGKAKFTFTIKQTVKSMKEGFRPLHFRRLYVDCSNGDHADYSLVYMGDEFEDKIPKLFPKANFISAQRFFGNERDILNSVDYQRTCDETLQEYKKGKIDINQFWNDIHECFLIFTSDYNRIEECERKFAKLETYDLEPKTVLFKKIYDERNKITQKTIRFNIEEKKFAIYDRNGNAIPVRCLSSGEVNDFVLFYELIFSSIENKIYLIDEPEISLHIELQETILDYFVEIAKLTKIQIIVATHSPNILNGHFDLLAKTEIGNATDK